MAEEGSALISFISATQAESLSDSQERFFLFMFIKRPLKSESGGAGWGEYHESPCLRCHTQDPRTHSGEWQAQWLSCMAQVPSDTTLLLRRRQRGISTVQIQPSSEPGGRSQKLNRKGFNLLKIETPRLPRQNKRGCLGQVLDKAGG